jgi:hypothetical protein
MRVRIPRIRSVGSSPVISLIKHNSSFVFSGEGFFCLSGNPAVRLGRISFAEKSEFFYSQ